MNKVLTSLVAFLSFLAYSQKEIDFSGFQPVESVLSIDIADEDNKVTLYDFALRLKKKFPQYQEINNNILVSAVLKKHPIYKSKIDFSFSDSFVNLYQTINEEGMTDKTITDFYIEYLPIEKQEFLYLSLIHI